MDRKRKIVSIVHSVSKKSSVPDEDESLFDSGYLDSFTLADMVVELEKEFQIKVPDSDLNPRKFDSIARIEEYLTSRS